MDSRKVFGLSLAAWRRQRGHTQETLATRASISVKFLAALEAGTKAPSFETLDALCEVLELAPDQLFRAADEPARSPAAPSVDLLRAIEKLPSDTSADLLVIVQAVSRLVSPKAKARRASGQAPERTPKTPAKRRTKRA